MKPQTRTKIAAEAENFFVFLRPSTSVYECKYVAILLSSKEKTPTYSSYINLNKIEKKQNLIKDFVFVLVECCCYDYHH